MGSWREGKQGWGRAPRDVQPNSSPVLFFALVLCHPSPACSSFTEREAQHHKQTILSREWGWRWGALVCVPVRSLASTREPWTKVDSVASPPCSYSFIVQRKAMSQGWELIAEATWVGHWRQWRVWQPSGFQGFPCRLTRPKWKHTSRDENHIVGLHDDTNYSCHVSSVFPLEDHPMKWV